jgi:hypothetical protein
MAGRQDCGAVAARSGSEPTRGEQAIERQQLLARRVRRRALVDVLLLLALIGGVALATGDAQQALLNAVLASAAGIMLFLYRRNRDLSALARADDWRADAVEGRGLSLSAWIAGERLPVWKDRRDIA